MIFKDYYKILGLTTNRVTAQEIKTAYKEQAKKYHPDLNGGNRKFEERFKDINEAYKVLSEASSKRKYDRIWYSNVGRKNKNVRKAPTSNKEAIMGILFGQTSEVQAITRGKTIRGENINTEIKISLEDALLGTSKTIGLRVESGKYKNYKVDIPSGIQNGQNIKLSGLGKKSPNGGKNGDLLVRINIENTKKFKLDGKNIKSYLLLTPWEAGLSKKIKFESIDGDITIFIPEGTQSGEKIVIEGKGYPDGLGNRGDLVLETKIVIPKKLTDEQKDGLKNLEKIMDFNPRI